MTCSTSGGAPGLVSVNTKWPRIRICPGVIQLCALYCPREDWDLGFFSSMGPGQRLSLTKLYQATQSQSLGPLLGLVLKSRTSARILLSQFIMNPMPFISDDFQYLITFLLHRHPPGDTWSSWCAFNRNHIK